MKQLLIILFLYFISFSISYSQVNIIGYEYWIDNNYDNKETVNTDNQDDSLFLDLTYSTEDLSIGHHLFHIRFKDSNGNWSTVKSTSFLKSFQDDEQRIVSYEYWIDDNYNNKVTVNTENQDDSLSIDLSYSTEDLSLGHHLFHIRFKDSNGNWSTVKSTSFLKSFQDGEQRIVSYEYWFDNDILNKVTISVENPSSLFMLDKMIDLNSINSGVHLFNIRFQSTSGLYSEVYTIPIYKPQLDDSSNYITEYRYWLDNDESNITTKYIDSASNPLLLIDNIHLGDLALASYRINIQFKDKYGNWSPILKEKFYENFDYIKFGNKVSFIIKPETNTKYRWLFGDGIIDTISNPIHEYLIANSYNVKLIIFRDSNVDTVSKIIDIKGIQQYSPKIIADSGNVSLNFYGFGFDDSTLIKLHKPNSFFRKSADLIKIKDNSNLNAKFVLNNIDTGFYDIEIIFSNDTNILIENGLYVEKTHLEPFAVNFKVKKFRYGRVAKFKIGITNQSNIDLPMPETLLIFDTDSVFFGELLQDNKKYYYPVRSLETVDEFGQRNIIKANSTIFKDFFTNPIRITNNDENNSDDFRLLSRERGRIRTRVYINSDIYYTFPVKYDEDVHCGSIVDFSNACINHDECYKTCYAQKSDCDFLFLVDLCSECNNRLLYLLRDVDEDNYDEIFKFYSDCLQAALIYYTGALTLGEIYYYFAQNDCHMYNDRNWGYDYPENVNLIYDYLGRNYNIEILESFDPNEIVGISTLEPYNFVKSEDFLNYEIYFENLDSATAAAQEVFVFDTLDKEIYDLSTFSLSSFTFGDFSIDVPPNLMEYWTDIDLRPEMNLILRFNAKLDTASGIVRWQFISLDPDTRELTDDPEAGFLPPNVNSPEGEGSVSFSVKPKQNLINGTQIKNKANIIFDVNEPIMTNEWINTIDNDKPWSQVSQLDSVQNSKSFVVSWNGDDATSDVQFYNVYYSVNDGEYRLWKYLVDTTEALFTGMPDSTYRFNSIAVDYAGNIEGEKTGYDAITTVRIEHQDFNLAQGWNTISSYIIPDKPLMDELWGNNKSLVIIKNNMGNFYYPSMELNTIGNWNNLEGYQSYLSDSTYFYITGTKINPQTPIQLSTGWNIIPYLRDTELDIEPALVSLGNSFIIVKDNTGNIYFPLFDINSIGNMKPGQGYQIYMLETGTLIYPE